MLTVLDCKKGYWHQKLDQASSYLTTFNTEFGRYQYTVMPFSATFAGNVFQRKLDQCFGHLQNTIVIADDIMVVGKQPNHKDHNLALTMLLNTARQCNVHLNYDKLQYKQKEVDFFGETLYGRWVKTSTEQDKGHTRDATSTMQEASAIIHWYD